MHPTAAAGRRPLPTRQTRPGRASPCGRAGAYTARPHKRRPRRLCHYRAMHSGPDWSPADNNGQRHALRDLRRSLPSQVAIRADLALQASGQLVEACTGLAMLAGRSGPLRPGTGALRRPRPNGTGNRPIRFHRAEVIRSPSALNSLMLGDSAPTSTR
jgi:hypothetical protein